MLILQRKPGESIRIGNDVVLKVLAYTGTSVRVWMEAGKTRAVINRPVGKPISDENGLYIGTGHSPTGQLRFMIEAPAEVSIWREELWQKIQNNKKNQVA